MTDTRARRHAKRFAAAFILVGGSIGVASLVNQAKDDTGSASTTSARIQPASTSVVVRSTVARSGSSTSSSADSSTSSPEVLVDPLPEPNLDEYCAQTKGAGWTAGVLNFDSTFACESGGLGQSGDKVSMNDACQVLYGATSRQVRLMARPLMLRCIPVHPILVGQADFDAYCRERYGFEALGSTVASDERGWRCSAIENGVYRTIEIAYGDNEPDWACQVTLNAEAFAVSGDGHSWACYEAP